MARSLRGRSAGGTDPGDGGGTASDRLVPGDPEHALAVGLEQRLPLGVVLAGDLLVVPGRAVGLDDQALLGPAEVRDQPATVDDQSGWLTSGCSKPASSSRSSTTSSSTVPSRGRAGCDHPRQAARPAPRAEPADDLAAAGAGSTRLVPCARRTVDRSDCPSSIAARSRRVRAGAVTGMPCARALSLGSRNVVRWTLIPWW